MSNNRDNYWDDEDEDDDFTPSYESETDLVKKLRKALKSEQNSSRGVNPKVAAFVPSDLDASEEAIAAWLDNNADVFGFEVKPEQEVSQRDVAALRQIDAVTSGALSPDKSEDIAFRINNANSEDEILKLIYGSQS